MQKHNRKRWSLNGQFRFNVNRFFSLLFILISQLFCGKFFWCKTFWTRLKRIAWSHADEGFTLVENYDSSRCRNVCMFMYVCVCADICMRSWVYMCVWKRVKDKKRERENVWVCVWERDREQEIECECMCVSARESDGMSK